MSGKTLNVQEFKHNVCTTESTFSDQKVHSSFQLFDVLAFSLDDVFVDFSTVLCGNPMIFVSAKMLTLTVELK